MSSKRLSSSLSFAAAVIEGNEDLLIEILVFLPAKFLVRLKLVSKQWRSLISAPSFCRRHTAHHLGRRPEPQTSFLLGGYGTKYLVYNPKIRRSFSFPFPFGNSEMQILQSCNGLLLVSCGQEKERRYFIFNPTTLQHRDLSPLPCRSASSLYIIFDPSSSFHYRVVCFAHENMSTLFHLYDSETHKWNYGGKISKRATSFRHGVSLDGGIYFLRLHSASRFDIDGKVGQIPKSANHRSLGRSKKYGMESNGFLLSLTLSWKEENHVLHVCEMKKENENGWSNKYRVDMNPILDKGAGNSISVIKLLSMIRGEKEQDSSLLFRLFGKIMIYKFYEDAFEVIFDCRSKEFQKENPGFYVPDAYQFIESLAPV